MTEKNTRGLMWERQAPLTELYNREPRAAWVTDCARTTSDLDDPLHGEVLVGEQTSLPFSLHVAVGGLSDLPVPGDIMSAALASCFDSTARVIADRVGFRFTHLSVQVRSEVDVRGTLCLDASVPVGFQRLSVDIEYEVPAGTNERAVRLALQMTEQCCVVFQTLKNGVAVDTNVRVREEMEVRRGA